MYISIYTHSPFIYGEYSPYMKGAWGYIDIYICIHIYIYPLPLHLW